MPEIKPLKIRSTDAVDYRTLKINELITQTNKNTEAIVRLQQTFSDHRHNSNELLNPTSTPFTVVEDQPSETKDCDCECHGGQCGRLIPKDTIKGLRFGQIIWNAVQKSYIKKNNHWDTNSVGNYLIHLSNHELEQLICVCGAFNGEPK